MHDVNGHELQVGDIVLTSGSDYARYSRVRSFTQIEGGDRVVVQRIDMTGKISGVVFAYRPEQLIWHSSDYINLPISYLAELFSTMGTIDA